jgi:alginate O-acetyltransferase complex protein AlgI
MSVVSLAWPVWMATAVAGHWLLPAFVAQLWIAVLTLSFLLVYSPESAGILAVFTLATYFVARSGRPSGLRLASAGAAILAVLSTYKVRVSADLASAALDIAIPLGLSYYALRCIHYIIERYKGRLPEHDFLDFASYMLFLPTLIAGPIHRFGDFQRDRRRQRWDSDKFSEGLERILYGYVKITFIANHLVSIRLAELVAGLPPEQGSLAAYLSMIQHGLNGYLQFSGYSDIAIGFALLLGYRVMENFRWPLLQRNISDFWKSWHISLSSWCREYVYMLVISFTRRPVIAVVATMLAIGLWHEASHRYVLWGVYNAVGIVIWQQFQHVKPLFLKFAVLQTNAARIAVRAASVALTFHFVMAGFVLVQQPSIGQALDFYRTLFGGL